MTFYQHCLGGELSFRTVAEENNFTQMPERMQNSIVQATLCQGQILIFGTDLLGQEVLTNGNSVSIGLVCNSRMELNSLYQKLSKKHRSAQAPMQNVSGELYCTCIDRFGVHWILVAA